MTIVNIIGRIKLFFAAAAALGVLFSLHAGEAAVLHSSAGALVKTLDPALAEDISSRDLTALCYDTLVEYDYLARPYKLKPSMLKAMPEASADFRTYTFELRDDLLFADDPVFRSREERRVTATDVKCSILHVADSRTHSPLYWLYRGKIKGLSEFREASRRALRGDFSLYKAPLAGFEILSPTKFRIHLTAPDPRFLYILAMPNAGIVSHRALLRYGRKIARHPVGSGPFVLRSWTPNLKLYFQRNPDYRQEFFVQAASPSDRTKRLPLLDGIEILQIRQPMTAWMMFLQGALDYNAVDKDNLDQLCSGGEVIPALKARGVSLVSFPEFEVRYVSFNFHDPRLADNLKLRQALSLSYNVLRRIAHASGQLLPADGPIPPNVSGYDPDFRNPWRVYDLERAKALLAEAGYQGGIDPATNEPLVLTLDQGKTDVAARQAGELAADDWRKLGIRIEPLLNSRPRFYEKLRQKNFQLFRLSWVGDYPDGENFLQPFYSGNVGGSNRCGFADREFDRLYEAARALPDSPERSKLYHQMVKLLSDRCVWICEGYPLSSVLFHAWLENYHPHDFSFVRWKYLSIDPAKRGDARRNFTPLSFDELRGCGS